MSDDQLPPGDPSQAAPPPPPAPEPPPPPAAAPPPPPPAAYTPPPAAPPPPPTVQPAAAPPLQTAAVAPQPVGAYAAAPPPPAKKSRAWIWILVVLLVLGCCAVAAIAIGFGIFGSTAGSVSLSAADVHWKKVEAALTNVVPELTKLQGSSSGSDIKTATENAKSQLDEADSEIQLARVEVAKLPASSQARKDYEAGLDEAATTIKLLNVFMDELSGVGSFSDTIKAGVSNYNDGMDNLNSAVHANNGRNHSKAKNLADKAGSYFRKAKAKFVAAQKLDPEGGADSMIRYCDLQIIAAGEQSHMGSAGVRHNVSLYNKYVNHYNSNQRKVVALPTPQILQGDYLQTRFSQLSSQITEHANKADEYINKAHSD